MKLLESWAIKEDDAYMNNRKLDACDMLSSRCRYIPYTTKGSKIIINKFRNLNVDIKNNIKNVIYNNHATIVLWNDGTKTVVKCQTETGDTYNPELGLAMCIIKKLSGNKGNYNDVFNKWLPKVTK